MKRVYYYSDELNDDFAGTKIRHKELPVDYDYFPKNPLRRVFGFLLYRVIATPIVFLYEKLIRREKIVNRKLLKKYGKNGYFLYANHTSAVDDAFTPTLVTFPKKAYILVNPDAVSIPVAGKLVEMLGGVPLPTDRHGMRNFHSAVLSHAKKNHCVMIYPEAHIWPYYTGIRPFPSTSFSYAAKNNVPAVPVCVIYRKPKGLFKNYLCPRVTLKVGKAVYPEANVSVKANASAMRDKVYEFMTECSHLNEISLYDYIKTTEKVDTRTQLRALKIARKQRAKAKRHLYEFGKKVYGEKAPSFFTDTFSTADNEMEEALETGYLDERHPKE